MSVSFRSILTGAGWLLGFLAAGVFVTTLLSSNQDFEQAVPDEGTASKAQPAPPLLLPVTPKQIALGPLKDPHILVEKSGRRLTVFDAERAVKSYRCTIGDGEGDKTREGDRCTPQGQFYVCVKNPKSKFTRSLGLSYPDVEDAARGLRDGSISREHHDLIVAAINKGTRPPWKTALGGEIMIHGANNGRDGTAGCIALEDDEIRELYPAIPLHTRVTIVP